MTTLQATTDPDTLRARWDAYKAENKRARIYDAAQALGVSEAKLLATDCGERATRLDGKWGDVLKSLEDAGRLMGLTRNHWAVIEKKGHYKPVTMDGHVGLVLDEDIDLRIFPKNWKLGFAVHHPEHPHYNQSLQFFDGAGRAVHKIYFPPDAEGSHAATVARFRSADQGTAQPVEPAPAPAAVKPDGEIDSAGLLEAWRALKDTHDFHALLKNFGTARTQACRLAEGTFTKRLPASSHRTLLEEAAATELPIMVFVGNRGCIEIHTGPVRKVLEARGWYNVMDPDFNLHLNEDGIHETWLVRKPTEDGVVTAVELFDRDGAPIAQFFGKRKPGIPELEEWRALAEGLPTL